MKNSKRILSALIAFMLAAGCMPTIADAEETSCTPDAPAVVTAYSKASHTDDETQIIDSGECGKNGDNVKYELHENGTLYLFGEGETADYAVDNDVPSPFLFSTTIKEKYLNEISYKTGQKILFAVSSAFTVWLVVSYLPKDAGTPAVIVASV